MKLLDPFVVPIRVVDSEGKPIESAELNLSRLDPNYDTDYPSMSTQRRTDAQGRYVWRAMPGKEIWVRATAQNLSTARTPHLIGKAGEIHPEIELVLRRPGDIVGRVVDSDGSPVADARVKAKVYTNQAYLLSNTGTDSLEDGTFRIPRVLREDNVLVNLSVNRRPVWPEPFESQGPADIDLDLGDIVLTPNP